MKILISCYFLLFTFSAMSQKKMYIIKDIFPTQTHDWIECSVSMPSDFKVQKIKFHSKKNRRKLYYYRFEALSDRFSKYQIEIYVAPYIHSDSSATRSLATFFEGTEIRKDSSFVGVVNDDFLITYKSFHFPNHVYFFTISVKHFQKKKEFNIEELNWFIEFVKELELSHNPIH